MFNLALKGSYSSSVDDDAMLASLVWFILAHLTGPQVRHIEGAREIHTENSLGVLQGVDLIIL